MKKTEEKPNSEEAPGSYQHTEENLGKESTVSRRAKKMHLENGRDKC
jgi:hypothetical protein